MSLLEQDIIKKRQIFEYYKYNIQNHYYENATKLLISKDSIWSTYKLMPSQLVMMKQEEEF